jgi:hypothetical protein
MKTLRIRPAAGRVVRDPDLHDLIIAPRTVPDSPFWRRRIRDGDVTLDSATPSAPAPTTQARDNSTRATTAAKRAGAADTAQDTGAKS